MKKNRGAHRSCKIYGYINCFKLSNHVCRQIFLQLETTSHKVANRRLVNLSVMSQKHIKLWSVEIFTSLWTVCTCFNRINCFLLKEILFLSRSCGLVRGVSFPCEIQLSSLFFPTSRRLMCPPAALSPELCTADGRCYEHRGPVTMTHVSFEADVLVSTSCLKNLFSWKNVVRQRLDTTSVWVSIVELFTGLEVICTILHHKFLVTTHSIWVHLPSEVPPFDAVSVINSKY